MSRPRDFVDPHMLSAVRRFTRGLVKSGRATPLHPHA